MEIKLHEILVRDLVEWYVNNDEEWVVWFWWKLDIRPKYQREFVYWNKERDAVMKTLQQDFPLNTMYWVVKPDWNYEVLDWQQRTISICEYVAGNYPLNNLFFDNLTDDKKEQIYNYKLMVYFCSWTDSEKLDWFRTVNISWKKLSDQELRNSVYTWTWLSDAKRHFSKTQCPAYKKWWKYLAGKSPIRQELLEEALKRISKWNIEGYMWKHQNDANADELWQYFQKVINWVEMLFPHFRKEMGSVDWGTLYNEYKDEDYNAQELEKRVQELMIDDDVDAKVWIYPYLITGDEKYLHLRAFTEKQKAQMYEEQKGICPICWNHFEIWEMNADHKKPRSLWWHTELSNGQMLCKECNLKKSNKY